MRRPLGTSQSILQTSWAGRVYTGLFGVADFHSHFRWDAIRRYVDWNARLTLEVGSNSGVKTFELAPRMSGEIVASEFDPAQVQNARRINVELGHRNVSFGQADLRELAAAPQAFDQALVIDVLEHIDDDRQAVQELATALRPGGRLVVSVPTPNYPRIFGKRFHDEVGHVRDGYWLEDIKALLEAGGFEVQRYHYYTGLLASLGCVINYRWRTPLMLRTMTLPLLRAFGRLGERNVNRTRAASLALVAIRVKEARPAS